MAGGALGGAGAGLGARAVAGLAGQRRGNRDLDLGAGVGLLQRDGQLDSYYARSLIQKCASELHGEFKAAGNDREARLNLARKRVIVMDLWTDTTDWAAVCDPRLYPTIGVGYRYGRQPEIFSIALAITA